MDFFTRFKRRCIWIVGAVLVGTSLFLLMLSNGSVEPISKSVPHHPSPSGVESIEIIKARENLFGPDVKLADGPLDVEIWAEIEAVDDRGIAIDGVKAGDTISISVISGLASFSGQPGAVKLLSVIYSNSVGLLRSAGSIQKVKDQKETERSEPERGKGRDGYGKDAKGNYARNEGGVIVCMPSAGGPMYAQDSNHLHESAESRGRLDKFLSRDMKGKCFFPVRGKQRERTATTDGVLYVLAFDENFKDNAGGYEIKLRIVRQAAPPAQN